MAAFSAYRFWKTELVGDLQHPPSDMIGEKFSDYGGLGNNPFNVLQLYWLGSVAERRGRD